MGFFQELLNGLTDGFSEITQCARFTECFNNTGAFEGMNETEKNAFILKALNDCGAANTPDTLLGEIYPIAVKEANENNANLSQPVAHGTCPAKCHKNRSTCGECLKTRLEILEALNYAERPEEYRRGFGAAAQAPTSGGDKCSLCGAPIGPSMSECDYCGTPVTGAAAGGALGASARFVPSSTMSPEQQAYELVYKYQLEELNSAYSPELKRVAINIQCAASLTVCPTMSKTELLKLTEESINNTLQLLKTKMSLSDLYFMAEHYHMNVPTYLRGLFEGDPNLKTAAVFRKEQQDERERETREEERRETGAKLERERELRRQQQERDRQTRAETQAKLKQIQQERHNRQLEMISNNAPQYISSHTCADCTYYSPGARKCAYKDQATNAGDSCGFFKWK